MGAFTSYSLSVSVFLMLGWAVYRSVLSGCKQAAFNRCIIYVIYILSFLAVPLGRALKAFAFSFTRGGDPLIGIEAPEVLFDVQSDTASPIWAGVLIAVYFTGAIIVALRIVVGFLSVCALIRRGERRKMDGFTLVVLSTDECGAPFSFGRFVVASEAELNASPLVLRHERGHIALGHRYDLLLANLVCIFQWFNPAAWLLRSDLRCLHEYEVDEMVLAGGADVKQYQRLLVRCIVGQRSNFMINSFSSNLKKELQ